MKPVVSKLKREVDEKGFDQLREVDVFKLLEGSPCTVCCQNMGGGNFNCPPEKGG